MKRKISQLNTMAGLIAALACLSTTPATASVLSDTANGMSKGTWSQLNTSGYTNSYLTYPGGNGQPSTQFMGNAVWDSQGQKVYFLGAGHFNFSQLHVYSSSSNTWTIGASVPGSPRGLGHGYYHNAIDVSGRRLGFMRVNNSSTDFFEFNFGSNSWTEKSAFSNDGDTAHAFVYFPERSRWYLADGTFGIIREYNRSSNSWSKFTTERECFGGGNSVKTGYYHNFSEYSPARKEIVFGGGVSQLGGGFSNSRAWCTMNSNGTITTRPNAPVDLNVPSKDNNGGLVTVDPQTGDLLVLAQNGNFYTYSFSSNSWSTRNSGKPSELGKSSNNVTDGWVVPIDTYGVIMYANSARNIWLYKHAAGSGTPVPPPSPPPSPSADTTPPDPPSQLALVTSGGTPPPPPPPPTAPPPPPPPSGAGFAELCQLSTTIFCQDFDQLPPNTASGVEGIYHNKGACDSNGILGHPGRACPELDNGALKFIVPSESGAGGSGQYYVRFADFNGGKSIKPGDQVYVRWKQRFSASMFAQKFTNSNGWKHGMIGAVDEYSCASNEIVVQNSGQRGIPQMYHACGYFEGFEKKVPGTTDFDYQPVGAAGGPDSCLRSDIIDKNPPDFSNGCFPYYADEWITYQVGLTHGASGQPSRIRLWAAREGQPYTLVIDYQRVLRNTKGYGKLWLLPYQTDKSSSQVHPEGYVWYDQVIISKVQLPE